MNDRKELVQKFIAKLKAEIQELRDYYNAMLIADLPDYMYEDYSEQKCKLKLCKLEFIETVFCNEIYYAGESNGIYSINSEILELLIIRDLNTAKDLMESVHFTSRFINDREFNFNLLSVFEYGLLKDQLNKENHNDT